MGICDPVDCQRWDDAPVADIPAAQRPAAEQNRALAKDLRCKVGIARPAGKDIGRTEFSQTKQVQGKLQGWKAHPG